jgi:hypothetical protein
MRELRSIVWQSLLRLATMFVISIETYESGGQPLLLQLAMSILLQLAIPIFVATCDKPILLQLRIIIAT